MNDASKTGDAWTHRLEQVAGRLREHPDVQRLTSEVRPPLDEAGVCDLENSLRRALPNSLRRCLLQRMSGITFGWSLRSNRVLATAVRVALPYLSDFQLSIASISAMNSLAPRQELVIRNGRPAPADEWTVPERDHSFFSLVQVMTGDDIGLDLGVSADDPPVAIRWHDGGGCTVIAPTLEAFIDTMTLLGFPDLVGPQLKYFCDEDGFLSAETAVARRWRSHFRLDAIDSAHHSDSRKE